MTLLHAVVVWWASTTLRSECRLQTEEKPATTKNPLGIVPV